MFGVSEDFIGKRVDSMTTFSTMRVDVDVSEDWSEIVHLTLRTFLLIDHSQLLQQREHNDVQSVQFIGYVAR